MSVARNCTKRNCIPVKMRTGFHLSVGAGSFCALIIEIPENGKNMIRK